MSLRESVEAHEHSRYFTEASVAPKGGSYHPERRALHPLLARLANVPPKQRALQLANAMLTPVVCRPFHLIHVVEHPKCGGSWIRNMICDYVGSKVYLADRLIRPGDVIQVHRLYRRAYARPVVVVRDPRDLYVSFYYHETRYERREQHLAVSRYFTHDPSRPLVQDFAAYLEAKLLHRTHPRFFYGDFVRSWLYRPNACITRYEDFLTDPEAELIRIVRFAGLDVELARIDWAVEQNRFDVRTKRHDGKMRQPGEADPTKFIRKGVAGDWRNHFDARSCELIQRFESWTLRELGYEHDRSWIDRFLAERRDPPAAVRS